MYIVIINVNQLFVHNIYNIYNMLFTIYILYLINYIMIGEC